MCRQTQESLACSCPAGLGGCKEQAGSLQRLNRRNCSGRQAVQTRVLFPSLEGCYCPRSFYSPTVTAMPVRAIKPPFYWPMATGDLCCADVHVF